MEENKNEQLLPPQEIPGDDIPLPDDELWDMPELTLEEHLDDTPIQPEPMDIMEPPASEQEAETTETNPVEAGELPEPDAISEPEIIFTPAEEPVPEEEPAAEEEPSSEEEAASEEESLEEPEDVNPEDVKLFPHVTVGESYLDTVSTMSHKPAAASSGKVVLPPWLQPKPVAKGDENDKKWAAPAEPTETFLKPPAQPKPVEKKEEKPKEKPLPLRLRQPRKGRPKRKKGYGLFGIPHLIATVVWLAIIVMIGTSLGKMIWVCAADVLAFGRESKEVVVTITTNDTVDDIADTLHEAGLIRYPELFKLYAKLAVDDGDILPGTFTMNTLYDYHALVVQMGPRSSNRAVIEDVLIPEGFTCSQIFQLLEEKGICSVAELEAYAANGEFTDFWFLEGVERGDKYCLEGFLFPDTYDFYANSTPREALGKMLLGFQARVNQEETVAALSVLNQRLTEKMRINGCSQTQIEENQLSLRDLLIVASLIEKETASAAESPVIASVIFNRYTQDQVYERYLGIDAAIVYATGDADNIDTSIDHPYNTYIHAGLTPGAICNPGLDSIRAALNFVDSPYYYYVYNPSTSSSQFSKTYEEHQQWVAQIRGNNG